MKFFPLTSGNGSLQMRREQELALGNEERNYVFDHKLRSWEHIESPTTTMHEIRKVPTAMDYQSDESDIFEYRSRYDIECRSDIDSQDDEPNDRYSEGGSRYCTHDDDIDTVVAEWKSSDESGTSTEGSDWENGSGGNKMNHVKGDKIDNRSMGTFPRNRIMSFDSSELPASLDTSVEYQAKSKTHGDTTGDSEDERFIRELTKKYRERNLEVPSLTAKTEIIKLIVENENRRQKYNSKRIKETQSGVVTNQVFSNREQNLSKRQEVQRSTERDEMGDEIMESTNRKHQYHVREAYTNQRRSPKTHRTALSNREKIQPKRQSLPQKSFWLFHRNPSDSLINPRKLRRKKGLCKREKGTSNGTNERPGDFQKNQAVPPLNEVTFPQMSFKSGKESEEQNTPIPCPVTEIRVPIESPKALHEVTDLSNSMKYIKDSEASTDRSETLLNFNDEIQPWRSKNEQESRDWTNSLPDHIAFESQSIEKEVEEEESLFFSSEKSIKSVSGKNWEATSEVLSEHDVNKREEATALRGLSRERGVDRRTKIPMDAIKTQDDFSASIPNYNCCLGTGTSDGTTNIFDCFDNPKEAKKYRSDANSDISGVSLLDVGSLTLDSGRKCKKDDGEIKGNREEAKVQIGKVEIPSHKDSLTWSTTSTRSSDVRRPRIPTANCDTLRNTNSRKANNNILELGLEEMQNELHDYAKSKTLINKMQRIVHRTRK